METIIEPFRIKVVEPIKFNSPEDREKILKKAHFNLFQVPAQDVIIDLLTDSGTSAMSSEQWANMIRGDESYAGASSWYHLQETVESITGMPYVLPTHQGRASERILFSLIGGKGKLIPSNNHFDTTRANIEYTGAKAVDLVVDDAYDLKNHSDFKGNLDSQKLLSLIKEHGAGAIPLCLLTITNNNIGGQPVSLTNIKEIKNICRKHNIPLFIDAARFAENALLIKKREKKYNHWNVRDIVKEIFALADGALISAKKDMLVNCGGLLILRDADLAQRAKDLLILTEGFTTYGGLAGRDLEAMACGFIEAMDEDYLQYRIQSVDYLAKKLLAHGISVIQPTGGHAVYVDAKDFCSHIPADQFPGQAIICALYRMAGIRATEIGSVMFGRNNTSIDNMERPNLELVRLAIPRRVYTQSHIDYVVEALSRIYVQRNDLRGLKIIEEPPMLRHFSAKFVEI